MTLATETNGANKQPSDQINEGSKPPSRKGVKRNWKDIPKDPLEKGFTRHSSEYVVGKTPVPVKTLKTGNLFTRNNTGKGVYVLIDRGTAVLLDTGESIPISPENRLTMTVYRVTSINTISGSILEDKSGD